MRHALSSFAVFVMLSACSLAHERDPLPSPPDAGADLGPGDLAPRCEMLPSSPCVAFEWRDDRPLPTEPTPDEDPRYFLDPFIVSAVGTDVVHQLRVVRDEGDAERALWSYARSTTGNLLLGEPRSLSEAATTIATPEQWGALVRDGESVLAAWREESFGEFTTTVARFREDDIESLGTVTTNRSASGNGALALTPSALVTSGNDGVFAHPLDRIEVPILIDANKATGRVLATDIEDGTIVVWSRPSPTSSLRMSLHAALLRRGIVERVVDIFDAELVELFGTSGGDVVSLLVHGWDVWIARFSVDESDLQGSRVRIARLDLSLERVGLDRWLSGWSGGTPTHLQLVAYDNEPWAFLVAPDPRSDFFSAFYAERLDATSACGYDVTFDERTARQGISYLRLFFDVGEELHFIQQVPVPPNTYASGFGRFAACD